MTNLRRSCGEIQSEGGSRFGTEHNVLGNGDGIDQHKMLMDHADSECNSIVRRLDISNLPVNEYLATVRSIKTIGDTHSSGLACAILANNGMNSPRANFYIYMIVR